MSDEFSTRLNSLANIVSKLRYDTIRLQNKEDSEVALRFAERSIIAVDKRLSELEHVLEILEAKITSIEIRLPNV